ncbi:MAG: ABC transporter substrate-binding protein [Methanoregula sp.]|jgi:iron complex transport system substrate-binding protein
MSFPTTIGEFLFLGSEPMTKNRMSRHSGNLDRMFPQKLCGLILAGLIVCVIFGAGCLSSSAPAGEPGGAVTQATSGAVTASATPTPVPPPTLSVPAERIIVTNANAAELLMAIGAKDKIVGVSDTVKNHPVLGPQFEDVESIGSWSAPDIEKILSLHPDTVVSYASYLPKNIDKITALNITVLQIDCYKIDTLASDTEKLGNITGNEKEAQEYIAFLDRYESLARSRTENLPDSSLPRVYFESYSDYTTLTGGSGADTLLTLAGGKNIAGLLPASSPKVNAEWVYAENPDVIVKVVAATQQNLSFEDVRSAIETRQGIRNVSAVKENAVYVMSNDIVYGPRAVIGLLYFAKVLHPDLFSDVDPRAVLDDYAGKFVPDTNQSRYMYP